MSRFSSSRYLTNSALKLSVPGALLLPCLPMTTFSSSRVNGKSLLGNSPLVKHSGLCFGLGKFSRFRFHCSCAMYSAALCGY